MLPLRLILIFLIFYIILSVVKSAFNSGKPKSSKRREFDRGRDEEEMVLDPQCHSYVPKSDAIAVSGKYFCSQECARLYLLSR
jgi:hypothetical protein